MVILSITIYLRHRAKFHLGYAKTQLKHQTNIMKSYVDSTGQVAYYDFYEISVLATWR
jgi:hypothetical protein